MSNNPSYPNAKIGPRLLAIFYDSLIIFFIIIISIIILQFLVLSLTDIGTATIPNGPNEAQGKEIPATSLLSYFFKSLWLVLSFLYFAYFWTKRGQTLGMKVWNLKVVNDNGAPISWFQSLKRYLFSLFGLGLFWAIFDKENLCLQDRLSQSTLKKVT